MNSFDLFVCFEEQPSDACLEFGRGLPNGSPEVVVQLLYVRKRRNEEYV